MNLISHGCLEQDLAGNVYRKELFYYFKAYFKEHSKHKETDLDYYQAIVDQ